MKAALLGGAAILLFIAPAEARFRHGTGPAVANINPNPSCPKGLNKTDEKGYSDECPDAPPNGVYQNTSWFGTGTGNARQSGQSAYALDDSNIQWNIPGVDNHTGYNTDTAWFNPANESFTASGASITNGVLFADPTNFGVILVNLATGHYEFNANGVSAGAVSGNPYPGQTLSTFTTTSIRNPVGAKIVSQIDATHWQTDNPSLNVASTVISGQLHIELGCFYQSVVNGYSATPVIDCRTTGDATTASTFNGYDGEIAGADFRIQAGLGLGADGKAGAVTWTNSRFKNSSSSCNSSSIVTGVGTHFDITIMYNRFDGNWPTCTQTAGFNSNTTGTADSYKNLTIKWNHLQNMPHQPMQNRGDYTSIEIANNTMPSFCMERTVCKSVGGIHGALFANSQRNPMASYIYAHNQLIAPKEVGASSITVPLSFLADATNYQNSTIETARVTGNIITVNCQDGGPCNSSTYTARSALWSANDTVRYNHLISGSNYVDGAGASGGYFFGGNARNKVTATIAGWPGIAILNVTNINGENYSVNTKIHVNSTPFVFDGRIAPSGLHDGLGVMTLDASNSSLTTNPVAGITVPPGICIVSKTDSTHFVVSNYYGTTDDLLTAPHQRMYTAWSVLPQTTDPGTGLPTTSDGTHNGTLPVQNCSGGSGTPSASFSTWNRFNPTIGNTPDVNDGTDRELRTGNPIYMGGTDWSTGLAP